MKTLWSRTFSRADNDGAVSPVPVALYPDPVAVTGPGWDIREANSLFESLVGCPPGGLVGRRLTHLCAETPFMGPFSARRGRVRRVADMEVRITRDTGGTVPVSLSVSILDGSLGLSGGAVVTARKTKDKIELADRLERTRAELERRNSYIDDFRNGVLHMIRDLDRSERELENACRELRETQAQLIQTSKLTALGEISAGLAHEINQPLTVIKGLVGNILRERGAGAKGGDMDKLRLISDACGRMEEITGHLRVFARAEVQTFRPVDVNRVVKDAFMMMGEYLHKHSIEVDLRLEPVAPIMGSPIRLEQVMINLVTNARDAMPGGGTLTVTTRALPDEGGGVEVVVKDTGKGMDREAVQRAFESFFTTKPAGKGTGLGLTISRNIVKEHGGDITVESEPGLGTAFTLNFPAGPPR